MTALTVSPVTTSGAQQLAACVNACFAHEALDVSPERAGRILEHADHSVVGAWIDHRLVGFCDSFVTRAGAAVRWEIDLLGVITQARGMGFARQLVQDALGQASKQGVPVARALVRHDNHPAQAVFAAVGFGRSVLHHLWVAAPLTAASPIAGSGAVTIPVTTLAYDGIWVERPTNAGALAAARCCASDPAHVVGAVVAAVSEAETWAEQAGYHRVGAYHWWTLQL